MKNILSLILLILIGNSSYSQKNSELNFKLGNIALENNLYQGAINHYDIVIKQNPTALVYYKRGIAYESLEKYQEALQDYTKAITATPFFHTAYFNRGNVNYKLGRKNNAIEDFTNAINEYSQDAGYYINRGVTYLSIKENYKGSRDADSACKLGRCEFLTMLKKEGLYIVKN